MKYCPKCGAQLVDEARFCSKCGAPQPNMENETRRPDLFESNNEPVKKESSEMTPSERYHYLKENDDKFKEFTRVVFLLKFVGLIGLLFIVPFLVCYFTPIGTFTGVNAQDYGNNLLAVAGKSYPYNFSNFDLAFTIKVWANNSTHKLTPDNSLNSNAYINIFWVFGYLFVAVIVLVSMLGRPRGYVLKTYEKDQGQTLYKDIKNTLTMLSGPAFSIMSLVTVIGTYINCTDVTYKDDTQYLFGVVTGNKSGLITCIVVTVIFVAIMLAASIMLKKIICKKLNSYYKK